MNGWLIYAKEDAIRNKHYIDWVIAEGKKLNLTIHLRYREQFLLKIETHRLSVSYEGQTVSLPDFAIVRTLDPFFSKQLEFLGIPIFNSSFVSEICNDKGRTHQYLAQANIPMVDTLFFPLEIPEPHSITFDYPFIVKGAKGRGGKEVYLVTSEHEFENCVQKLENQEVIVQKLAGTIGKDIRVFVIGKEIIAAVLRSSNSDFKANFTLGGEATLYELSDKEKSLIDRIINMFDFGLVGIDFLLDEHGDLLFNEIEDVVGSRTLSATSSINIVELYLKFIMRRLNEIG
ncbi:ATP-grasp domain-containing protein [Bacillus sp. FJAT-45350]|uniref:ATP-grasp domain-containing protein n=1 Tax=Bacillus sp. FJAT-45350 TaxID=2011014 RepID=UPI000BB7714B|nr:ATP-grasp domain-containing protein [Bacillus sp. FJAT-45350]